MGKVEGNPGDKVKIRLAKREVEGILLTSHDATVTLLKLDSGYNIGILNEKVLDSVVVKKGTKKELKVKIPFLKGKKNIGLVITGGTIASKLDSSTGGVSALTSVEEFALHFPRFFNRVNVRKIESPFMELSENMNASHWIRIAEVVKKMLDDKDIDGVIVTHGTDFLHYTAAALSFSLRDLNKPVVLTYSQRSIDRGSSDAQLNLECAAHMAGSEVAEVMLVGHATNNDDFCYALRGTKCRKMHTSRRNTFKAVNSLPIAKVWPEKIEFLTEYRLKDLTRKVKLDSDFSDKVALLKFYPGQKSDILDYYVEKGYKGIVIEVSGLGHVSVSEKNNWISKIRKLIKQGVFVCAAAQTIYGRLNPKVYSTGRELQESGLVYLEDILPETAFVKLEWVLGHRHWRSPEKIKEKMLENISLEFNEMLAE